MLPILAWPAAVLVGVSLGMLGSGGSILTVPLLHAAAGLSVQDATVTSLPIVGAVALVACLQHHRRESVHLRAALPFAAASFVASFASRAWLAPLLTATAQVVAFAGVMAVAAWRMAGAAPHLEEERARRGLAATLAAGTGVGVLTGLLGIGGGFVIVPVLVLVLGFHVRSAVGTSLAVIALNCAAGLAGHYHAEWVRHATTARIHGPVALLFGAAGIAGAVAGVHLAHRLPHAALRRGFAVVLVAMTAWLLVRHFA